MDKDGGVCVGGQATVFPTYRFQFLVLTSAFQLNLSLS